MASRFWARGSDSEDESEDETEEETESEVSESDSQASSKVGGHRFMAGDDSDSSEEAARVVLSAKDKRFEDLSKACEELRNKIKVNDWLSIQSVFDKIHKHLEKAMKASNLTHPPKQYIHMLVDLEDYLNETLANKDVKKKMSPTNARALNTMKQRLRKHLPEYEVAMAAWREHPVYSEKEDSEEEGSDEEGSEEEGSDEDHDRTLDLKKDELLSMDPEKITYEMISKKQRELAQARGRRSTDRQTQLEMLQFLVRLAKGPVQKLEVQDLSN